MSPDMIHLSYSPIVKHDILSSSGGFNYSRRDLISYDNHHRVTEHSHTHTHTHIYIYVVRARLPWAHTSRLVIKFSLGSEQS